MARRRGMSSAVGVDLFAFMNIMATMIGVQAMLISIIALQIRPGSQSSQFVPGGSGGNNQGKVANYILLQGKGQLELLANGQRERAMVGSPVVNGFLDRIANARKPQYLVIGVKPGTYREFNLVRAQAEAKGIPLGYEPFDSEWSVKPPPAAPTAMAP